MIISVQMLVNTIFKEKLCVDARALGFDAMTKEMIKEENMHIKKLSFTNFYEIIPDFNTCPNFNLEIFSMRRSHIYTNSARVIARCIAGSALLKLKLQSELADYAPLSIIMTAINKSCLKKIELKRIDIRMDEARHIIDAVRTSQLMKLSFTSCIFGEGVLLLILEAIKVSTLKILIFNRTHPQINNCEAIAIIECINNRALTKLSLDNILFPEDHRSAITQAIHYSSLTHLSVLKTPLFGNIVDVIKLIENVRTEKFSFDNAKFSIDEKIMINDAAKRNNAFRYISFRGEHFVDRLMVSVCDLLENSFITSLNLNACNLNGAQISTIIGSIKKSSVVSLNLDGSDWNNAAVRALCDLLETHPLAKLTFDIESFEYVNRMAIINSIRVSSLIKLNTYANPVHVGMETEARAIIKQQKNISKRFQRTKSARS